MATEVAGRPRQVLAGFTAALFRRLSPPLPAMNLLRFDGCQPGDVVRVELDFGVKKVLWESHITAAETTDTLCYFVDEGQLLPLRLHSWRHTHGMVALGEGRTRISDEVSFSTRPAWWGLLLYPGLYLMLLYRKPIYKRAFTAAGKNS